MSFSFQWERCDEAGGSCVPVPGATGVNYILTTADVGSTIRVIVSDGVTTATSAQTASIGTPGTAGGFTYNAAVAAIPRPAFSHTGATYLVDGGAGGTIAQVAAHISGAGANMVSGDLLTVKDMTIPINLGGFVFRIQKQLSGYAKVIWDNVQFTGPVTQSGTNQWSTMYFGPSPDHWYFDFVNGSNFTNPLSTGQFITSHGMNNCVLDNMYQHNVAGGGGGFVTASDGSDIHDNLIVSEIHHFCTNATFDPHAEKGTGVHGILVADANPFVFHHNKVAIWATDASPYGGSAIETGTPNSGNAPHDNEYWVRAERLTMKAISQVAGNAVNLWGTTASHGEVFHVVEALDCAGRAVDTNGYGSDLAAGAVRVVYGRADGCAYAPSDGFVGQPWDPRHNVLYEDIATNTGILRT